MIGICIESQENNLQLREQPQIKTEMAVFLANAEMLTPQKHEPKSVKEIFIKMGLIMTKDTLKDTHPHLGNKSA